MSKGGSQLTLFPEPLGGVRRPRGGKARMFFALWPDETTRMALARAAIVIPPGDAVRAQWVRTERYHLTLAFLGEIEARQAEVAELAAEHVHVAPFHLRMDQVGHFEGPNVVWIGPQFLPPELTQLKAELDRELLRYGLPLVSGKFTPHITCLRGVREAPDSPPVNIGWSVDEFVLVKSVTKRGNSKYRIVKRWPLRRPGLDLRQPEEPEEPAPPQEPAPASPQEPAPSPPPLGGEESGGEG